MQWRSSSGRPRQTLQVNLRLAWLAQWKAAGEPSIGTAKFFRCSRVVSREHISTQVAHPRVKIGNLYFEVCLMIAKHVVLYSQWLLISECELLLSSATTIHRCQAQVGAGTSTAYTLPTPGCPRRPSGRPTFPRIRAEHTRPAETPTWEVLYEPVYRGASFPKCRCMVLIHATFCLISLLLFMFFPCFSRSSLGLFMNCIWSFCSVCHLIVLIF